jgi:hypothetical protein
MTVSSNTSGLFRLEVRLGSARPAVYEVGDGGFLVGSVAGCDLRLNGANLAPVICLIARHAGGASLRQLTPGQSISVNGRFVHATQLHDGDKVAVGPAEILVSLAVAKTETPSAGQGNSIELEEKLREVELREQRLQEQLRQLQQRGSQANARGPARGVPRFEPLPTRAGRGDVPGDEAKAAELSRQEAQLEGVRRELARIKQELTQKYTSKRDKLQGQIEKFRKVRASVRRRVEEVTAREEAALQRDEELRFRQTEIETSSQQMTQERDLLEEQHRLFAARQQESQREFATRNADLSAREQKLQQEMTTLIEGQKQHQSDLLRLDRSQGMFESRQKQLELRVTAVDEQVEQLQRDSRDLEEQATQLDEWHQQLVKENERLTTQKREQDGQRLTLEQRAAALEGQQTMLATLRTRMERTREDLQRQEQALSRQRLLQEQAEADLRGRIDEVERIQSEIGGERLLFEEERRRFDSRRAEIESAVSRLRAAEDAISARQSALEQREKLLQEAAGRQGEETGLLLSRSEQLRQVEEKIQSERESFREREERLQKASQNLALMQERLHRRGEEIEQTKALLDERLREIEQQRAAAEATLAQKQQQHEQSAAQMATLQQEILAKAQETDLSAQELTKREQALQAETQAMEQTRKALTAQKLSLDTERLAWETSRQSTVQQDQLVRDETTKTRDELAALLKQLPDIELRSTAALERLSRSREQLREHLAEIHSYSRQSREDLDNARKAIQADADRVRTQEMALEAARDEHRIAVTAFRQQLIEWQGLVGEMRQTLQVGSSQLDLRQADLEAQARQTAETTARLAVEAQQLEEQKREVLHRKGEVDRHLVDMRQWYRKKLREIAGIDIPADQVGDSDLTSTSDERNPAKAILSFTDEVEPADRELGDLLASAGLVDEDTLHALWAEARRQRRSLRQLLLTGGHLSLYQMALIESGNLDGLILGPVRVIERLPSTPREAVYRVFDPRRNSEAVLRHLAEAEMQDAVRPDEFTQRFSAAASIDQGNIARVLEVLMIAERPAVLVEHVRGMLAADFPGLVSTPGVWFRLVLQVALGLEAIHASGLTHGRLDETTLVLDEEGTIVLLGLGEPRWLRPTPENEPPDSVSGDLLALGRLAFAWATPPSSSKAKAKPLPQEMLELMARLVGESEKEPITTATVLVEELKRLGPLLPSGKAAWDRLLEQVRESNSKGSLTIPKSGSEKRSA